MFQGTAWPSELEVESTRRVLPLGLGLAIFGGECSSYPQAVREPSGVIVVPQRGASGYRGAAQAQTMTNPATGAKLVIAVAVGLRSGAPSDL